METDSEDGLSEQRKLIRDEGSPNHGGSDHAYTYEEAIDITGYGKFHIAVLLLCGWAVSSDAIEVLSVSFLLPAAECDLQLTSVQKGWLNAIIFLGMMFGGYIWGALADLQGRRAVLLWSLLVNGLGGLSSSFVQTYWLFLLLRFISGVGVGGSMPVIFSYFVEFQPKGRRGTMVSVLATFWMSGNIIAAGLAYLVIPHPTWGYFSPDFTYNSWRIYVALCTIPAFSSSFLYMFMPESPKFLMEKGKEQSAIQVLKRIYKSNKGSDADFPIKRLYLGEHKRLTDDGGGFHENPGVAGRRGFYCKDAVSKFFSSTVELFKPPLTVVTIVIIIIFFTLSFGYYGLFMWFPEIFKRIEQYGGSACSHPPMGNMSNTSVPSACDMIGNTNVYFEGFLTALANLPGNILTILLVDRLGRKFLLVSSMVLSGVSVFLILVVQTRVQNLIVTCLFSGISVIGWNTLDVLGTELFPTHLRTTSMGLQAAIGRIAAILANVVFGVMVDTMCAVPLIMITVFLVIGGLSGLLLPNTTHIDLK